MPLFAPVCPPRIYNRLFSNPRSRGMYFLLLAHDVVASEENKKAYAKLFAERKFPAQVHLDNSVIELGDSVSMELLWDAADVVKANTIVLPDVLCKSDETYDSTMKAFEDFQLLKNSRDQDIAYPRNFMVIPQGEDFDSWLKCLDKIAQGIGPDNIPWVGIPRNITGRIDVTRRNAIEATQLITTNAMIHLMGFSDNIFDDFRCCFMNKVAGIDSAVPMRFKTPFSVTGEVGKRGNWWDECQFETLMQDNVVAVRNMLGDHSGFVDESEFRRLQQQAVANASATPSDPDIPKTAEGDTVN